MAELEELEQEELDKNLLEIEGTEDVPLPSVPSTSLPSRPGILKKQIQFSLIHTHKTPFNSKPSTSLKYTSQDN